MKRVPKPVFFIVALLILAFTYTAIFGVSYYEGDNKVTVLKGISDIRWGIDIRGGVEATFKPADGYDATDEQLKAAKAIIELRMVSQGITDYELYADRNSDRISFVSPGSQTKKILTRSRLSKRYRQRLSSHSDRVIRTRRRTSVPTESTFTKSLPAKQPPS